MTKEEMRRFYEMMEKDLKESEKIKKIFDLEKLIEDVEKWSIIDE